YDVEIIEAHHHFKKDAPSGTAERMAEVIAHALGRDLKTVGVYGRHGMVGERGPKEIGVHAIRAGDLVGEHTVLFGGIGERIEVTVRSQSRDSYVQGALRAASWVVRAGTATCRAPCGRRAGWSASRPGSTTCGTSWG
ncbi:MAG: dapB, partial [candidate division NC10 bacterium]|nr:dapB [candidate division NC10 bacterium]